MLHLAASSSSWTQYHDAAESCRLIAKAMSAARCWFHRGVQRAVVPNGDSWRLVAEPRALSVGLLKRLCVGEG
jgi:hypothetical protein